jgi:hypothetical protein
MGDFWSVKKAKVWGECKCGYTITFNRYLTDTCCPKCGRAWMEKPYKKTQENVRRLRQFQNQIAKYATPPDNK